MQVTDGNVVNPHQANSTMPQCDLGPFSTIKQELLLMHIDHLRRRVAPRKRQRSTASQDVDFEPQVVKKTRSANE